MFRYTVTVQLLSFFILTVFLDLQIHQDICFTECVQFNIEFALTAVHQFIIYDCYRIGIFDCSLLSNLQTYVDHSNHAKYNYMIISWLAHDSWIYFFRISLILILGNKVLSLKKSGAERLQTYLNSDLHKPNKIVSSSVRLTRIRLNKTRWVWMCCLYQVVGYKWLGLAKQGGVWLGWI